MMEYFHFKLIENIVGDIVGIAIIAIVIVWWIHNNRR